MSLNIKNKQYVYGVLLALSSLFFGWIDWPWMAGIILGFVLGFALAVDRVYKVATGKELTGKAEDDVYDKIL